ncbi:MAG: hypothetical protein QGD88_07515, partial [Anaerolineae bacterium]|nr:hypothetical protein [Anaerolineae bacterium]
TITETNTPKINIGPISNFSATVTFTPTSVPYKDNIIVRIIGCNTGFDIRHGMGEVTNGFVELQNQTGIDLTNLCTTLFAIDEGRLHPDKTMCTPVLKHDYQVTLMLTVDSTYKQATLIQVEVSSQGNLLSRVDRISCIDIEYLSSKPDIFMTPVQIK